MSGGSVIVRFMLTTDGYAVTQTRKDGKLKVLVTDLDGKKHTHICRDPRDAGPWTDQKLTELREQKRQRPATITFGVFAETVFFPKRADTPTETERRRHYDLYVAPKWAETPLDKIDAGDVMNWLDELKVAPKRKGEGTIAGSYVHQIYYSSFSKIITEAQNRGALRYDPLPPAPGLAKDPPKLVQILTVAQIEHLAWTLRTNVVGYRQRYRHSRSVPDWALTHYALVNTLAYGGMRISEALALTAGDLVVKEQRLRIDKQLDSPRLKTDRGYRMVNIPFRLVEMLVELIHANDIGPADFLFTTHFGTQMQRNNWKQRWFDPAVAECGFGHVTPHTLRHVAATAWHDTGFTLLQIANMLGDSVEVVEKTYVNTGIWTQRDERHEKLDARMLEGLNSRVAV
jgi:integrase